MRQFACNCYRPNPFPCPFKLVQTQCWNVHVANDLCFVKLRENQAEPFSVNRLDSGSLAGKEEFLQSSVSEGFDHKKQCNPFGYALQPIGLRSPRTTRAVQRSRSAAAEGGRLRRVVMRHLTVRSVNLCLSAVCPRRAHSVAERCSLSRLKLRKKRKCFARDQSVVRDPKQRGRPHQADSVRHELI